MDVFIKSTGADLHLPTLKSIQNATSEMQAVIGQQCADPPPNQNVETNAGNIAS